MQRSEHRILTTHAGSLPRPAELTRLFARRAGGETVDESAIETQGRAAVRDIVRSRSNRARRDRRWRAVARILRPLYAAPPDRAWRDGSRPMHADLDAYPQYKSTFQQRVTSAGSRVQPRQPAEGDRRCQLPDPSLIETECADFRAALDGRQGFVEAFLTAPSPGIIASIVQNEHYDTFERYLDALGAALRSNTRR